MVPPGLQMVFEEASAEGGEVKLSTKLYVGNLDYGVNDASLEETFSAAGTVTSANVITDRYSGRSRGFGFVEMSTEEDAQKAIEMFNGKETDGRALVVNEARPQQPRAER